MCVIIIREPGVTIDPAKIESACGVNPDGFGLLVPDRGKLEVIREFNPKGNDPERVLKLLEDNKDVRVALHLRYSTAGNKNLDNCHPFPVLTREANGVDVQFMHNGTLSEFTSRQNGMNDSYNFSKEVVSPLLEMAVGSSHKWDSLPIISKVLTKYASSSSNSIFTLFDEEGNVMIINGTTNGAAQHEGWWSSNTYSFRPSHREVRSYNTRPTTNTTKISTTVGSTRTANGSSQVKTTPGNSVVPFVNKDNQKVNSFFNLHGVPSEMLGDIEEIRVNLLAKANKKITDKDFGSKEFWEFVANDRDNLMTVLGLEDVSELASLDYDDLFTLVQEYPSVMTYLMMDMLFQIWAVAPAPKDKEEDEEEVQVG